MFENVGRSIKLVAKILFRVGVVLSVALGVTDIAHGYDFSDFFLGILTIAVGSLLSWLTSLIPYGFGQLIENSDIRTELAVKEFEEKEQ